MSLRWTKRLALWTFVALHLSGCQGQLGRLEMWLMDDSYTWMWVLPPLLAALLFGAPIVFGWRARQLSTWNLAVKPSSPSTSPQVIFVLAVGGVALLAFFGSHFAFPYIEPMQAWRNGGTWLLGTAIGTLTALLGGLKLSESLYVSRGGK